jgi:hypothetical protein
MTAPPTARPARAQEAPHVVAVPRARHRGVRAVRLAAVRPRVGEAWTRAALSFWQKMAAMAARLLCRAADPEGMTADGSQQRGMTAPPVLAGGAGAAAGQRRRVAVGLPAAPVLDDRVEVRVKAPCGRRGPWSRSDAASHLSLASLYRKCTRRRLNDSTAHGYLETPASAS